MSQTLPPLVVAVDDALEGVLDRLRRAGAGGRPVDLVIPADSALLLTAAEFRALRDALDHDRLAVTLRTDDPLRTQLARLLGIPVEPAPRESPTPTAKPPPKPAAGRAPRRTPPAPSASSSPPTRSGEPSAAPASGNSASPVPAKKAGPAPANRFVGRTESTADAAAPPKAGPPSAGPGNDASPATAESEAADAPERPPLAPDALWPSPPSPEAVAARRRSRRSRLWSRRAAVVAPPASDVPEAAPESADAAAPESPMTNGEPTTEDETAPLVVRPADERRRQRTRTLLIAAGALVALVGLVYLLLPGATVAITLKRQPLAGDVVYDITTTGQPLDGGAAVAVPAQTQTTDVTWEGKIPATGVRVEPTDRASAPILFANPTDAPIQVDAGTQMKTETGVVFTLVDAVTVPPRDPATGKAGQAQGTVRAADAGSGGNVGVGEIGGKLPNGVYYSNRERAASGGAEKRIPVVAKADFDALRKQAAAALPQAAAAAFARSLPSGQAIVPETIAAAPAAETFSAAEGDATDTLSVKMVWHVSALAYDQAAATRTIAEAAARQLGSLAPAGYVVDPATVKPGAATVAEQTAQGVRLKAPVAVDAVALLTQPQRRALAERLAGADPKTVDAVLRETPQIDHFSVSYHPVWLPDRMPTNVGRIQIVIQS